MKATPTFPLIIALLGVFVASGCGPQLTYRTRLAPDEAISERAEVLVDTLPVGFVKELRIEAGERIAVLALTDTKVAQEKMKVGLVRVIEDGRIHLRSDAVQPDSPTLPSGSVIPAQSRMEFTVRRYATQQTLVLGTIALLAVLILCLVFRKAFNLGLVIVCLALAGLMGWVLHPYLVPHIQEFYAATPGIQSAPEASEDISASAAETSTPVKEWERRLVHVLEQRPNPRVAAFAAILVLSFIPLAILMGAALRALRRRH